MGVFGRSAFFSLLKGNREGVDLEEGEVGEGLGGVVGRDCRDIM